MAARYNCDCMDDGYIVQYTTPTIRIQFHTVDPATILDGALVFKAAGVDVCVKDWSSVMIEEDAIAWKLSQTDTAALPLGERVRVYCDYVLQDGTRSRSRTAEYDIVETGIDEVM